jgi:hypothetical protein
VLPVVASKKFIDVLLGNLAGLLGFLGIHEIVDVNAGRPSTFEPV